MGYIAKNNARSQLAGTLLIAGTTATLDAGEGALFAVTAPEWTYATFFDGSGNIEHVKVTARATDALTIVRAQDGTAAREWPVGTYIECRPIAAALADYAVAPQVNGATAETTIADADEVGFVDVSASNALKKITWANVVATLKTYFDGLYRAATGNVALVSGAALVFEGSTDDGFETTVSADDPTADRSITLPDYSGAIAVQARGADIASATTVDLDAATGDIADVTGTTSVTAITLADGVEKSVRFTGALTLTNGASLILPGAANITTAAGDVAVFRGYAAGVVRCVGYQRASGLPVVAPAATPGLGVGQTWQDVKTTPGRVSGTTYTNSTGAPIAVAVTTTLTTAAGLSVNVDGIVILLPYVNTGTVNTRASTMFVVPDGSTYSVTVVGATAIDTWAELR